jgi:hypothetical protein
MQLNHKHSLYMLANKINWNVFETEFSKLFNKKMGAPNKPIRLMTGLIILKHVRNVSDESVVEQFQENAYYQYFCGEQFFTTKRPCDPSELVHFRHLKDNRASAENRGRARHSAAAELQEDAEGNTSRPALPQSPEERQEGSQG